jgi:tonB family C-domain protein
VAGYSVVMFSLDTLGLPRGINILTSIHKDFDKEVIRLTQELPHCLPCRDKNGKRMECFYTVYVPFLPQHYKDRVKTDSVREEELKQCLVEWESGSYFQKGNPYAITNYINEHLRYNPKMLGNKNQIRGIYTIQIDSYGEVSEAKTMRSCRIPEWDNQVLQIIKSMPRWTPAINYWKGEYCNSVWTVPVLFKNDSPTTPINPHTDVSVIGYSTCDTPVLMRYDATLTAHTTEPYLEVGVPVCYLNEQGDTIVPYGKYRYCQTDTIKKLGFVYEHKPKDARIICINNAGKELFYVFKYDNGPDYIQEGLFRIMNEDGLVGFADSLGNVAIKPQFKFAYPFEHGKAKVTFSGENKVIPDSKGEKHYRNNSDWYYINKNGKIINK